jgi:Flp pilus assembly protein CpaB
MTFYFLDVDQDLQMDEPICPPVCSGAEGEAGAMLTEQHPRLTAQLTLQDLRVLGVGRWRYKPQPTEEERERAEQEGEEPVATQPPQYITLMLTPQDALVLKLAREQGASIDLAVRATDDAQQFSTQQVTLDYIMARFGVSVPPKQPYRIQDINAPSAGTE